MVASRVRLAATAQRECVSPTNTEDIQLRSIQKGTNMSDQANIALVLSVYDAFRRGDIAAILKDLDPQADLNFEGPSAIPRAGNGADARVGQSISKRSARASTKSR